MQEVNKEMDPRCYRILIINHQSNFQKYNFLAVLALTVKKKKKNFKLS